MPHFFLHIYWLILELSCDWLIILLTGRIIQTEPTLMNMHYNFLRIYVYDVYKKTVTNILYICACTFPYRVTARAWFQSNDSKLSYWCVLSCNYLFLAYLLCRPPEGCNCSSWIYPEDVCGSEPWQRENHLLALYLRNRYQLLNVPQHCMFVTLTTDVLIWVFEHCRISPWGLQCLV
jgi:hypothetical protein